MKKRSILIVYEHFEENFNEVRRSLKYFSENQPIVRRKEINEKNNYRKENWNDTNI